MADFTWIMILINTMLIVLFFTFAYLIVKKKKYGLLKGFYLYSKEEQERLISIGYPQANARVMIVSGLIFIITMPLVLLGIPYSMEITYGAFLIYLFTDLLIITNKMYRGKKKVTNNIVLGGSVLLLIALGSTLLIPTAKNVSEGGLSISGLYSIELNWEEISSIELVETLPTIQLRNNGRSLANKSDGHYTLEGLGRGRLFLENRNEGPYIYLETDETYVFINEANSDATRLLYNEIQDEMH
ncbi:hypothetical protein JCM19045_172 [Bacillus sp. JCM 19045]|nr:hypothetical protein JCM19045_172 [Bacillus sp. JCM 19045]